MERKMLTGQDF